VVTIRGSVVVAAEREWLAVFGGVLQ
jgi:hypothetical protein